MRGLRGRIALVTGATGLIGGAIANRLAAEDARVVIASRSLAKAQEWRRLSENHKEALIPVQLDLADGESIKKCLDDLAAHDSLPTIVVASASLRDGLGAYFEDLTHSHFGKLFEVDLAGHVLLLREIVARLGGEPASFIFLSSIYAQAGVDFSIYPAGMMPTPVQYAATKAAVEGAARWLAAAWGGKGVRVNALVPGGVRAQARQSPEFVEKYSQKTMLRRLALPEEVASAAVFLASDEASYVTGQCLIVDGGFTAW